MAPTRYSLADVDGTLCIVCETTDYNEPNIVSLYWPTIVRTRDLLSTFDETDLTAFTATQSRPGEYFAGVKQSGFQAPWKYGRHISLVDGGRTLPVKTETRPAPPPKVRKGTNLYWSAGAWCKLTSTKHERIDPLSV